MTSSASDGVVTMEMLLEDFYIHLEETRQAAASSSTSTSSSTSSPPTPMMIPQCHHGLSILHQILQKMYDIMPTASTSTDDVNHVYVAMVENCTAKARILSSDVMKAVTMNTMKTSNGNGNSNSSSMEVVDEGGVEVQQAIAQMLEITLRLHYFADDDVNVNANANANTNDNVNTNVNEIVKGYTNYQRHVLRHRSKPSIATLATLRKYAMNSGMGVMDYIDIEHTMEQERQEEEHQQQQQQQQQHVNNNNHDGVERRPHAAAVTVILGEACSLIHPLMMWKDGTGHALAHLMEQTQTRMHTTTTNNNNSNSKNRNSVNDSEIKIQETLHRMTVETIQILHEEAQNLSSKVGQWFLNDHNNNSSSNNNNNAKVSSASASASSPPLESHIDEMAFLCQVFQRYITFISNSNTNNDNTNNNNNNNNIDSLSTITLEQHLVEHIFQYTSSEQDLIASNLRHAIHSHHATPVQMIIDTERYVPSIVEDAYYISQRSLERASGSCLVDRAVCMLANWIVGEVWGEGESEIVSSNSSSSGEYISVYRALMEQKGCCFLKEKEKEDASTSTRTRGNQNQNQPDNIASENGIGNGNNNNVGGSLTTTTTIATSTAKKAIGKIMAPRSFNAFLSVLDRDKSNTKKNEPTLEGGGDHHPSLASVSASTSTSATNSAPASGNLNGGKEMVKVKKDVDLHKVQMDTQFCLLNGIHAASSACMSLHELFNTLLPENEDDDDDDDENDKGEEKQIQVHHPQHAISKEASMMILAQEQLQSHSQHYNHLLKDQIGHFLKEWIGSVSLKNVAQPPPLIASLDHSPSMHRFFYYVSNQEYNLTAETLRLAEDGNGNGSGSDSKRGLGLKSLLTPFQDSRLIIELRNGKCDEGVTLKLLQLMSHHVVQLFLSTLLHQRKEFSEWGSLLLSRQIRALEEFFCDILSGSTGGNEDDDGTRTNAAVMNTSVIRKEYQKIAQALTILQCGKPSDWMAFKGEVGDTEFDLTMEEIGQVMGLRVDWSMDTIRPVCS
uniref:Component of oligomeric Golgi complex 4 n=1 Tax=Chaetoceros debilis TaxID=122233 RepID=A0A7S3V9W4_9STRA